jgi:hypothetical protein
MCGETKELRETPKILFLRKERLFSGFKNLNDKFILKTCQKKIILKNK